MNNVLVYTDWKPINEGGGGILAAVYFSWVSLSWKIHCRDIGSFVFEVFAEEDTLDVLKLGNVVHIQDEPNWFIINSVVLKEGKVIATGNTTDWLLSNSPVIYYSIAKTTLNSKLRTIIRRSGYGEYETAGHTNFKCLEYSPNEDLTNETEYIISTEKPAFTQIKDLCLEFNLGYKIVCDEYKFIINFYKIDEQIIKPLYQIAGDIENVEYSKNSLNYSNRVVISIGEGHDTDGIGEKKFSLLGGWSYSDKGFGERGENESFTDYQKRYYNYIRGELSRKTIKETVSLTTNRDDLEIGRYYKVVLEKPKLDVVILLSGYEVTIQNNTVSKAYNIGSSKIL